MAQSTPILQGETLTYQQDGHAAHVLVNSDGWYSWLERASTFTFRGERGSFTARKERAGNRRGGMYWRAYRKRNGKLLRAYLGKSEELTLERLQAVAAALADMGVGNDPPDVPEQAGKRRQPAAEPVNPWPPFDLPVPLTSFVGRERQVQEICSILRRPGVRLLTLTGTGGVGKTRLALEVAREVRPDYVDGVCFVPLAPVSDPDLVTPTIAQALGLRQAGGRSLAEQVQDALRDRHLLLLLDNVEQVIKAAPRLVDLLTACPHLKLLVTSRAVLRLSSEYEFTVPPLTVPDLSRQAGYEDLAQRAVVRLFLERAQAIQPGFALTPANIGTIAEICTRLDGLPLAIELAAARIKLLPPQALLKRLSHRLEILTGGVRDLPARHQTLRDTLKWSYDLLDAQEQRFFRRLSVFVNGWTLEAVEAVVSIEQERDGYSLPALDGVASLLDKSLLLPMERDEEEPHPIMLETIREYGLERLAASGELEMARRAHAAYYLAQAEQAEKEQGGEQQAAWLEWLEREHENMRAALQWLLEQKEPEDLEKALRLAGALWWFWSLRGYVSEGRSWLKRALERSEQAGSAARAKTLSSAGMLALNQDDYSQAEVLCRQSLALFEELGDRQGMATALYRLGLAAWLQGNQTAARALQEQSLALYREVDDRRGTADPLLILSDLAFAEGDYSRAYTQVEESLGIFRELDDQWGVAYVLPRLARVLTVQGEVVRARTLVEECLAVSREIHYKEGIGDALSFLGRIQLQQGETAAARALAEDSLLIFRSVGDRRGTGRALCLLAKVIASQSDNRAAQSFTRKAWQPREKCMTRKTQPHAWAGWPL